MVSVQFVQIVSIALFASTCMTIQASPVTARSTEVAQKNNVPGPFAHATTGNLSNHTTQNDNVTKSSDPNTDDQKGHTSAAHVPQGYLEQPEGTELTHDFRKRSPQGFMSSIMERLKGGGLGGPKL